MSRKKKKKQEPAQPGRFRPFADLEKTLEEKKPPAREADTEPARKPTGSPVAAPATHEEAEFIRAVSDAHPIPGRPAPGGPSDPRPAKLPDEEREFREFANNFIKGTVGFDISWSDEYVEGRRHEVSRQTMKKLRAGQISYQDYLDLHGMTRDEARRKVESFIARSRRHNHWCVLVVHGRGKGSHGGRPVLKEKLVAWLTRDGGIGAHVIAFATARPCDGGPGAVYVLLRRE